MLKFVDRNLYMRRNGNGLMAETLQQDDSTFIFCMQVYDAISMKDPEKKVSLYVFSSEERRLCEQSDSGELVMKELGTDTVDTHNYVSSNDVGFFIGIPSNDYKTFASVKVPGHFVAYDENAAVRLTTSLSADTRIQLCPAVDETL